MRHRIGQCNNAFIFPGMGLGACVGKAKHVSDGMFLEAAKALATHVTEEDIKELMSGNLCRCGAYANIHAAIKQAAAAEAA